MSIPATALQKDLEDKHNQHDALQKLQQNSITKLYSCACVSPFFDLSGPNSLRQMLYEDFFANPLPIYDGRVHLTIAGSSNLLETARICADLLSAGYKLSLDLLDIAYTTSRYSPLKELSYFLSYLLKHKISVGLLPALNKKVQVSVNDYLLITGDIFPEISPEIEESKQCIIRLGADIASEKLKKTYELENIPRIIIASDLVEWGKNPFALLKHIKAALPQGSMCFTLSKFKNIVNFDYHTKSSSCMFFSQLKVEKEWTRQGLSKTKPEQCIKFIAPHTSKQTKAAILAIYLRIASIEGGSAKALPGPWLDYFRFDYNILNRITKDSLTEAEPKLAASV